MLQDQEDNGLVDGKDDHASMKFNIVAGVLDRARQVAFERMLWRVSKGNVFIKFSDIEEQMEDPQSGNKLYKSVFMIFFQVGDTVNYLSIKNEKSLVNKDICLSKSQCHSLNHRIFFVNKFSQSWDCIGVTS